jgi:hypothetical protein
MTTRICVLIDLDTDQLDVAYGEVHEKMTATGLEWESSDEWYYDDGDPVPEFIVSAARMRILDQLQRKKEKQPAVQHDYEEALNWVWTALHGFREDCIPEGRDQMYDDQWDDICTGMAWIREGLGLPDQVSG